MAEDHDYGTREGLQGGQPFASGPEQLFGADPVASFGQTVEQALRNLAVELAGLRAERDGLRLELEGLRAQLDIANQRMADRDQFAAAVRDLNAVAHRLSPPPPVWAAPVQPVTQYAPVAPQAYAPPVAPVAPEAPPQAYAPPVAPVAPEAPPQAYAPPVAPVAPEAPPQAYAPPVAPVAPEAPPQAYAPPEAPVPPPLPVVPMAPPVAEAVPLTTASPAPPAADPPPVVAPLVETPPAAEVPVSEVIEAVEAPATEAVAAPAPVPVVEPVAQPVPSVEIPDAIPEPLARNAPLDLDDEIADREFAEALQGFDDAATSLVTQEERFFDQPGIWIGEPPTHDARRGAVRKWVGRIGMAVMVSVIGAILLMSVGPKFLPYQTYFVRSGSMEPTISTGDMIVLTEADAADLKIGDIITFERPDKPGTMVTHRIKQIQSGEEGRTFTTKGDANSDVDGWQVPSTGTGWKYAFKMPKVGYALGYLQTSQARLALLAIPAAILGLLALVDIWKPKSKAGARR